jgi:hypothetical protein
MTRLELREQLDRLLRVTPPQRRLSRPLALEDRALLGHVRPARSLHALVQRRGRDSAVDQPPRR